MGNSAFYITDNVDDYDTSDMTKCSEFFLDGGFKNLTDCTGRYLIMRRTGTSQSTDEFTIMEIRAFTVINLLEGAALMEAPTPTES